MASDIVLTAASRSALLSIQTTTSLMGRTQGRLTTGLKVSSAIDDAVLYFKGKSLTDRAADFTDRKTDIDQGISAIKVAVHGTTIADSILKQLKGLVSSARTADVGTRATMTSQFNELARQLNSAETDASYQGLNLVNNSIASLNVYFNQGTTASLLVAAQNLQTSVLVSAMYLAAGAASDGTLSVMLSAAGATAGMGFSVLSDSTSATYVLDQMEQQLAASISTTRAASARLGGTITFLQTRLDFTGNYINTMSEGSGKMTLADLNEEGANMMALQTRQQIGIQSLSIAGQQQQAVLSLMH
ncbi:MAG: flagellin [Rhodospirillaceae bacterium]